MAKKTAGVVSTCICGEELQLEIEKPSYFEPTIAKVTCKCGSKYMVCSMRDKKTGLIELVPQVLEVSEKASEIAKARILAREGLEP